jgi:hypothetical protein
MQRWNWFMAADFEGKWITTNGYADVEFDSPNFSAILRFSPDADPYQKVVATLDGEGGVDAVVSSLGLSDPAPFKLQGPFFQVGAGENAPTTILLTDGSTVLGLTYGPRSNEDNP